MVLDFFISDKKYYCSAVDQTKFCLAKNFDLIKS